MTLAVRDRLSMAATDPRWRPVILVSLAGLVVVLAWPVANQPAQTGLDPSWQIALHLAVWERLRFGVDFVMTYGPLGFLGTPRPVLGGTSSIAFVAYVAMELALAVALIVAARRVVPLWAAAILALLAMRLVLSMEFWETFQALVFVAAAVAIASPPERGRARWALVVVAGIVVGVVVLGKLSVAPFVVAFAGIAVLATAPDRRAPLVAAGVAGATAAIGWFATGQGLGNLVPYVTTGLEVVSRYSQAMSTDRDPAQHWLYLVFAVVGAGVAGLAWQRAMPLPRVRRVALLAIVGLLLFAEWKTAFTRGNPGYSFSTLLLAAFPLATPVSSGTQRRGEWLAVLGAAAIGVAATFGVTPGRLTAVATSARSFAAEAADAVIPSRYERAVTRTREQVSKGVALPPEVVAALRGRSLHVMPWETSAALVLRDSTWAPLPYFQGYEVWSTGMDGRNAERLRAANAPDAILREITFRNALPGWLVRQLGAPVPAGQRLPATVDGRFQWFEEPATTLERLCRYREVVATERWQVLERTSATCGEPRPLTTVTAREGEAVNVPAPPDSQSFVIVRVQGLDPDLATSLVTALWKGPEWYATIGGLRYRLVPGTAADGLLLAVPPGADGSGNFRFGDPIREISIQAGLDEPAGRTLTYEFLSVPWSGRGTVP